MAKYDDYEMTIGIECHVQLKTATKLFSSANNDAREAEPNSCVSAVDYGLPGMLPVLNKEAVHLAVRAAKALGADVARESSFDRKHYFYPDLPKGYQTTQMYQPIILSGTIEVPLDNGEVAPVRIHHAHLEEDAGKLTHESGYSLVDLNRAGTPLIEIVSEPDIHSAEAARAYATELQRRMVYAGVTYGDLYHGNMRFDVNISVAKKGASELGVRTEIKNLNSFRSVERAAEYEFKRQIDVLEAGEKVRQETRGWDDTKQATFSQRSKEDAQDYRYMPDADIPPVCLSDEEIAAIWAEVPELPADYRKAWSGLGLDRSVVDSLLAHQQVAQCVREVQQLLDADQVVKVAYWFANNDQLAELLERGLPTAESLAELAAMTTQGAVSSGGAKEIFAALFTEELSPKEIAQARGLLQNSDTDFIAEVVEAVLADPASQRSIEDIKNGKDKAIGYLVGQVMKRSQGKANPAIAQKLIRERL